jgi:hypothetical protein
MFCLPPIWVGWSAVVLLPLAKRRSLVLWQYLRMLRLYVVFIAVSLSAAGLAELLQPKPGSPSAIAMALAVFIIAVGLWIAIGRLLDRFEFVRLLRYSNSSGTVTIRFSTQHLARKASQVLIAPPGRQGGEQNPSNMPVQQMEPAGRCFVV